MKKTFKTIAALLIIGMSFTACTKDEAPTPTPAPIDIRDAAEGIFQITQGNDTVQFEFVKNDSIGQMLILDPETNDVRATMFIIMETMDGFTYGLKDDIFTGRYDKNEDMHTLTEPQGEEWYFLRVN